MRFLILLLAACPGAQAQLGPAATPAVLNPVATPAPAPAAPDTAAALHRLFSLRRNRGYTAFKVGGAMLAVSAGLVAGTSNEYSYKNIGVYALGILGLGSSVPVLATGVIRTVNYSKKREQRALLAWQQHHLPRRLTRALEADSLLAAQSRLARAVLAASSPKVAAAAARDTAAALHQLFAAKRRLVKIVLPLTVAASVGFVPKVDKNSPNFGNTGAILLGTTTLLVAGEVAILRKYSKKREAQALLALKEHRLPARQRQELKAEYFRPAQAAP